MDSEASSGESQDSPVLCRRVTTCSGVGLLQSTEPTSTEHQYPYLVYVI